MNFGFLKIHLKFASKSLESSIKINDNDIVTKTKEDEALKEQTDAFEALFLKQSTIHIIGI